MNIFDNMQDTAFDIVATTMGYPASWQPAIGGPLQNATVLYNENTEKYELSNMAFEPTKWHIEYRNPFFVGLKASVDKNVKEIVSVTVRGVTDRFYVRHIVAKYDGQTMVAFLQLIC